MNFFRTSAYSAISQIITVVVGLISVKIVASKIGADGVALQGQFINTTAIISIIASCAIGAGVIKYLAQYTDDKAQQLNVIKATFTVTALTSIAMGLAAIIFAKFISAQTLKDPQYDSVFVIYGIFLPLISFNTQFTFMLNGLKHIKYLTIVNIFTSIISLIFLIILSREYQLYGVLVSASFANGLIFILHITLFMKYKWFSLSELRFSWDNQIFSRLFRFSVMSLLAGFGMPLTQILIRDRIIDQLGVTQAGYWQMVTRISDFYLTFIVTVMSVYFLPAISQLQHPHEIKKEIYKVAKFIFPATIVMAFGIWICRDLLIDYLLTEEFRPVRNLFHYQLAGDVVKVAAMMLSIILWAKAMTRKYLMVDSFTMIIYTLISFVCIGYFGLIGASIGFLITNFIYFVILTFICRKYLF